ALKGDTDYLSQLIFTLTEKHPDLVILLIEKESLFIAIGAGKTAAKTISSATLIKAVAKVMGGSGGGKPTFARGSGKKKGQLTAAIAAFEELLLAQTKK
ncbi:MAG: hypothetical protein DRO63_06475, partial [Candidatus Gerdarchaeota archaeon]